MNSLNDAKFRRKLIVKANHHCIGSRIIFVDFTTELVIYY